MNYIELLFEGKIKEAESLRISENPSILYKYVFLDGTEEDEKRYTSLRNNSMWFSKGSDVSEWSDYVHLVRKVLKILKSQF
ncbi:MAG: hypothetical protein MJZ11_06550 [Lachnospiraceae bacterium]|nr:hypothetical protein [Lachnospiraceae bacterium]